MGLFPSASLSLLQTQISICYGGSSQSRTTSLTNGFCTQPNIIHKEFADTNDRGVTHNDKSNFFSASMSKLQTSAVNQRRCHARMAPKMCDGSDYSRLRLGKNVLNFFHLSQNLAQARVAPSKMGDFELLMYMGKVFLKEGEMGLDGKLELGVSSRMLTEAALRFAAASAIDPLSIDAAIAWGITLLTHGKLQLSFNKNLRDMLSDPKWTCKKSNAEGTIDVLRDMIPKVCEESENLLVEAGRKLGKAALLEKGNDFALYTWGLSLFYRAQLIAADGPNDAMDNANKLYLIAIEKFKATSQLGTEYSGVAYLSWALALRDLFWLQRSVKKEDISLLEQAEWASQKALQAYPSGLQTKLVAQICTEELAKFQKQ